MVELIEYVIAFGISAGVAGASLMVVSGAIPGLNQVGSASLADQVAGAARIAVLEGRTVNLLVPLLDSYVSCQGGSLTVTIDGGVRSYQVGYPCSFSYAGLSGECTLTFSARGDSLGLAVVC